MVLGASWFSKGEDSLRLSFLRSGVFLMILFYMIQGPLLRAQSLEFSSSIDLMENRAAIIWPTSDDGKKSKTSFITPLFGSLDREGGYFRIPPSQLFVLNGEGSVYEDHPLLRLSFSEAVQDAGEVLQDQPERELFIYVSGHGSPGLNGNGAIDGNEYEKIIREVAQLPKANTGEWNITLFFTACYSGDQCLLLDQENSKIHNIIKPRNDINFHFFFSSAPENKSTSYPLTRNLEKFIAFLRAVEGPSVTKRIGGGFPWFRKYLQHLYSDWDVHAPSIASSSSHISTWSHMEAKPITSKGLARAFPQNIETLDLPGSLLSAFSSLSESLHLPLPTKGSLSGVSERKLHLVSSAIRRFIENHFEMARSQHLSIAEYMGHYFEILGYIDTQKNRDFLEYYVSRLPEDIFDANEAEQKLSDGIENAFRVLIQNEERCVHHAQTVFSPILK